MARGRQLSEPEIQELRQAASTLPPGTLRPFAEEQAALLGCHYSTIYRAIQPPRRTRARRSDSGALRSLDEEALLDLAAMVARFDYDAELAIDTYNANRERLGLMPLDIHPETLRRQLRARRLSRRDNAQDLRVHHRWEAPYAGYLQQIDSTCAWSYYIDADDTIGYEAAVRKNKNKIGNGKPRVWLIGLVDDHSRVRWGRFYTSNAATAWLDCMLRAWRTPEDPDVWPAYGVPERVYSDQDAAMKSGVMRRALEALQVEILLALPSTEHETNAQAKGKAEATLRVFLHSFEKATRFKRFDSLEAMNEAFRKFLISLNRRVHSETKEVPFERWLRTESIRVLPPQEITRRLSYKETARVITSNVSISLEGTTYQLPRERPFIDWIGRKVPVLYLEADLSRITVLIDREEYDVAAVEALPDVAGEWKSTEAPTAVALKRELLERDLSHIDPHAVWDYRVARTETVYPIRPREVAHPLTAASLATPMVAWGPAVDRARKAGVVATPPTPSERGELEALFGGDLSSTIPEPVLQQWIDQRRSLRHAPEPTPLLRVERA